MQSYRENEHYMKNNKVASKTSSVSVEEASKMKETGENFKKSESEVNVDFDKDVKLQN